MSFSQDPDQVKVGDAVMGPGSVLGERITALVSPEGRENFQKAFSGLGKGLVKFFEIIDQISGNDRQGPRGGLTGMFNNLVGGLFSPLPSAPVAQASQANPSVSTPAGPPA